VQEKTILQSIAKNNSSVLYNTFAKQHDSIHMLDSSKFKLKLLTASDSQAFFTLIQNNRKRLEDFFAGTLSKTSSLKDTIEYCKEIQNKIERKEYYPYLIIDKTSNSPIGLIDI